MKERILLKSVKKKDNRVKATVAKIVRIKVMIPTFLANDFLLTSKRIAMTRYRPKDSKATLKPNM